ncbi:MAG: hypothetical protein Kow0059_13390 [Candidatus Sumerlaeia bacterium]
MGLNFTDGRSARRRAPSAAMAAFWPGVLAALIILGGCRERSAGVQPTPTPTPRPATAFLEGIVTLAGAGDHTGIMVYIPGTSFVGFTDAEGAWRIPGVPVGVYDVFARFDGYRTTRIDQGLRVTEDDLSDVTPVTIPPAVLEPAERRSSERERMGGLKGVVTLEGAQDNSGITVQVRGTIHRTVTGVSGEFIIPYIDPGEYALTIFKTGYRVQTLNVTIPAGKVQGLDPIVLARAPDTQQAQAQRVIEGTVEIFDRKGQRQNIFDQVRVGLEGTRHIAVLDAAGHFTITGVPPGIYVVTATAPGYEMRERVELDLTETPRINVGVRLDESERSAEKTGDVSGRILVADAGEGQHSGVIIGTLGHSYTALSGPDGSFRLEAVPEGVYTFMAQKEGYVPVFWDEVNVVADQETQLGPGTLNRFVETPRVVFTDPGDGAQNVSVQRQMPVFVRFNKKMNPDSVRSALRLTPEVSYRAFMGKESLKSDFDLLYIVIEGDNPRTPVSFDTRYTITIDAGATDVEGVTMAEDYSFSFTTGRPEIIATIPPQNETQANVTLTDPIVISFNATIDPGSVEGNIEITPEPFGKYYYNVRKDFESGWSTLFLYVYLKADTIYTVRFRNGLRTLSGDRISNTPFDLRFKTLKLYTYEDTIR